MTFGEMIKPPLTLTVICCIVSGLLAAAHEATYVDTTGVMTDKLRAGCEEIFGEGEYSMLTEEKQPVTFGAEGVDSVIVEKGAECRLIEYTGDGYATDGLHILVGFGEDGSVAGISFITLGETPGLGTKVSEESFYGQFIGFRDGDSTERIDAVTAATFSSNGMKKAVADCASVYSENREAIFGGE